MAILYKTDSTTESVFPKDGKIFSYEELQDFVGEGDERTIGIVPLPSGRSMIVNDNGKLIGLKTNLRATDVWKAEYPIKDYPHNNDELIVGNALVVEAKELEEE